MIFRLTDDKVEANFAYDNKMKYLKEICSEMKSYLTMLVDSREARNIFGETLLLKSELSLFS